MPMDVQSKPVRAGELLAMPDDGFRYELVYGELKKMAPAGGTHGMIAMDVATALNQHVKTQNLGRVFAAETGFLIASEPDTVRAPDAAFVRRERIEAEGRVEGYWPGAPDLAVEVVSPNDTYTEVEEKVMQWLEAGTRMVVVITPPQRTATVYRSRSNVILLTESDILDGGDIVPGWSMPLQELFS